MPRRPRRRAPLRTSCALLAAVAGASAADAAITGVCPDGSIFIVQSAAAIPCRDAKRVEPEDVPPLQPEFLPRPYGWEVFNRRSDPNNPYNVVGSDRPGGDAAESARSSAPPAEPPQPQPRGAAPVQVAAAPPARGALALDLSAQEIHDLAEIVALTQSFAPATFAELDPSGTQRAVLALARSAAFEERVHGALARRGGAASGPVVLFRAQADAPAAFHGNLTFVQGHVAFHPDPDDPAQFGVLDGGLGGLAAGDAVLGYAVLPEHVDPARPLDVYWNDRRITATLRP